MTVLFTAGDKSFSSRRKGTLISTHSNMFWETRGRGKTHQLFPCKLSPFCEIDNHINISKLLFFFLSVLSHNSPPAKLNLVLRKVHGCFRMDMIMYCHELLGELSFEISFLVIASIQASWRECFLSFRGKCREHTWISYLFFTDLVGEIRWRVSMIYLCPSDFFFNHERAEGKELLLFWSLHVNL